MKHCIVRYMARELWEEFLPFGIFAVIIGLLAGGAYGLKWLLEWLGILDWFLLSMLILGCLGISARIVQTLWILYQEARQNCEGDR